MPPILRRYRWFILGGISIYIGLVVFRSSYIFGLIFTALGIAPFVVAAIRYVLNGGQWWEDLAVPLPEKNELGIPTKPQYRIYTITLPQRTTWEAHRTLQFMQYMLHYFNQMVFRIVADHEAIVWQITDLYGTAPELVERAIRASYPDVEVDVADVDFGTRAPFYRYVMLYSQANDFVMPIHHVTDLKGPDPLVSIVQAMNDLEEGERIIYTLIVVGRSFQAYTVGRRLITRSVINPLLYLSGRGIMLVLETKLRRLHRVDKYVPSGSVGTESGIKSDDGQDER